tara:strand:- start:87 stop:428 length:342 start_codon:yes stop_codon:yes gene_type:complete
MTDDLNLHVEAIRALFKKRFSGGCTYFDIDTLTDSKSIDILKGKDDVDKNFDWSVCGDDLDEFQADITGYVAEKKIGEEDIIKLIDEFTKSNLEIDVKIGSEIDSLYASENIP